MTDTARGRAIEGLLLMLGLIVGGWILGSQIKATRLADRYVTVKGLVERNAKSDLAIWPISFKESVLNLQNVLAQSEKDKQSVLAFLKSQGFTDAEISIGDLGVTDRSADIYNNTTRPDSRFVVSQTITLTTKKVDRAGLAGLSCCRPGKGWGRSLKLWRHLQIHRPELAEAGHDYGGDTQCACGGHPLRSGLRIRGWADPFSEPGVFSISAANAERGGEGEGDAAMNADSSVMKKVRVVITVDYYLIK